MAAERHVEEEGVAAEMLRKQQLGLAVKSLQWSYAIFWSISSTTPGVLEWGDGYYNGDIKTRKTVQAAHVDGDQVGIQRTEQLRELYESLADAEANPQSTRPSASLSPEDLTDTEWYFLVCMSFVFNVGQGMPGRTLTNNQTIWLCNAHSAESKVFSRSLLAKSASIQTVVCFPYSGGVIELGTTDLVKEDPDIIQQVKTSFLETPPSIISNNSNYDYEAARNDEDIIDYVKLDQNVLDTNLDPEIEWEEINTCSPNDSSEKPEPNRQANEPLIAEGVNEGASQGQSWQFMEDEISNFELNSENSSNCVSQTFGSLENIAPVPNEEKVNDDIHYKNILSTLTKKSNQLIMASCFHSSTNDSSFVRWKNGGLSRGQKSRGGASQRLLKKAVYDVAKMHNGCLLESQEDNNDRRVKLRRSETDEIDVNHVLAERRRREKISEKFVLLGSLVPSTGKVDKVSILNNTIDYLRKLESRVEELESQKEVQDMEARRTRKHRDIVERTSDNYGYKRICNGKKPGTNKRKGSDIEEMKAANQVQHEDDDVTVSKIERDVLIEIKCRWREGFLLEIMDSISDLQLEPQSVQSSNIDGNLDLTIKSKVKGSAMASVKTIRQALQRITRKCRL